MRSRRRAGSPTMTLPSGSRLTIDGQSVLPYGPGIHFGWPVCPSMYAARLLVVPRSIPTILPINALQQFLLHVGYEISDVRAAIQQVVQLGLRGIAARAATRFLKDLVPIDSGGLQLAIDFGQFLLEILLRRFQAMLQVRGVAARHPGLAQFIKRFIQFKHFFEQFRRSLLLILAFLARAFDSQ